MNDGGHGRKDVNRSDNPEAFAMDNSAYGGMHAGLSADHPL